MTTFTSDDRQEAYKQKVEEAPYHPGYEDAVITPRSDPVYKGMDPAKMLWKPKPLTDEEIAALKREYIDVELFDEGDYGMEYNVYGVEKLIRAVEERHGIK